MSRVYIEPTRVNKDHIDTTRVIRTYTERTRWQSLNIPYMY
jgi:hypothetical protein